MQPTLSPAAAIGVERSCRIGLWVDENGNLIQQAATNGATGWAPTTLAGNSEKSDGFNQ
jgi:hypothetical protein